MEGCSISLKMSARVVLVVVLVSIVSQSQCQQSRFVELPFDDNDASSRRQEPVQFSQIQSTNNQRFPSFNGVNFQHQNPAPTPAPIPPFSGAFPDLSTRRPQHQVRGGIRHNPSPFQGGFPTPQSLFEAQPQPVQQFPFPSRHPTQPRHQFPSFVPRPAEVQPRPTLPSPIASDQTHSFENQDAQLFQQQNQVPQNAFLGIEEPTLTHIGHAQRRPQQELPVRPPPPVTQAPRFVPQQRPLVITEQPRFEVPQRFQTDLQHRNQQDAEEKIFREQAANAKYSFASQIDDSINGNQHEREETRDGLAVKGKYSYSDGYVKRTVFYEADEKGYRVVKAEEEPLGSGPQVNPKGQANVSTFISGNTNQYSITAADIQDTQKTFPPQQQQHQPQRPFGNFAGSNSRF